MAVATGSQIRPELSAVDYTPFLQAAGQSAQMQAQGIAAGVGGALRGFESYVQQQKENKQLEAEVKSAEKLGQALQPFLAQVNPEAGAQVNTLLASVADPNVSLRERSAVAKNIGSALNNILNLAQLGKQTQDQKAAAEYAGLLRSGGGAIPAPISNAALSRFTPEQRLAGEEMFLRGEQTRVGIEETKAKTKALGVPKPQDLTFQEQAYNAIVQAEEAKQGFPLTPQQKADVFSRVSQMNRNLTNVTVGEGAATKVFTDLRGLQSNISALREVSSNYEDAINEITKSGAFSGPSGAIKYAGARALQLFGSDAFKSEAEAYQSAASAIANSVLAIARSLPGAASDKDVMFLERVAGGGERVASAETLKKLKERVERKLSRIQTEFNADLAAFGEQAKEGDQNIKFLYGILSGRNKSLQAKPSAQPAANETDQSIFDQADAIITR